MEEKNFRKTTRQNTLKPINEPTLLSQCQNSVERLNNQLSGYIQHHRQKQLSPHACDITKLTEEIGELERMVEEQSVRPNCSKQRQQLISQKQQLTARLKHHSSKIEQYRNQLTRLNIKREQLLNELSRPIAAPPIDTPFPTEPTKPVQSLHHSLTLPTLSQRASISSQSHPAPPSGWEQLEQLIKQMRSIPTNSLSQTLLLTVQKDKGDIAGLMRSYQLNQSLGEYIKDREVRQALRELGGE